ncbi:hypothetical protein EV702DRAFT_1195806 [Suillus placidus]|uniref:Uncharacterized protein n=1 Tax=Suillus placidus TaxID=48579 RepID=A0A9P7D445_9AGAM|nr:hypothetical protein EV702DRAFT_1195806 [Suillus placidus]
MPETPKLDLELSAVPIPQHGHTQATPQQDTRPNSPSLSCLDVDATNLLGGGGNIVEEGLNDPYDNFFQSSQPHLPSSGLHLSPTRRFWNTISLNWLLVDQSVYNPFKRSAHSKSVPQPATSTTPNQSTSEVEARAGEEVEQVDLDVHSRDAFGTSNNSGQHRDEPPAVAHVSDHNSSSRRHPPTHSFGSLGRLPSSFRRPRVVDVAAVRDKQALFVARRPERDKAKQVQEHQKQLHSQAQTSASQTQPAIASTSTRPPAPGPNAPTPGPNATTPSAAATRSQPIRTPLWARLVLFLCCASPPHTNGH